MRDSFAVVVAWYPELGDKDWETATLKNLLTKHPHTQCRLDRAQRVAEWRLRLEEDEAALIQWIKSSSKAMQEDDDFGLEPVQWAANIAAHLSKLWNPLDWDDTVSGRARWRAHAIEVACSVPLRGQQSQQWRITGPDLQRRIRIGSAHTLCICK